jgi:Protein of unknown function (DUF3570).
MQLKPGKQPSPLRDVLHTAALTMLLIPATARAEDATDRIDFTSLLYGEQSRTQVIEPLIRFTHLAPDGQSISAQLGIDVITGASPSGALPSGTVQTHTSASGRVITSPPGQIPTAPFRDRRLALDGEWQKPIGRFMASTLGGHISREKDYQSLGLNGKISTDVMHRLFTLTLGGGVSHDTVFPVGGTPAGLSDGTIARSGNNPKDVTNVLFGVSHVMSRRWILGINGTETHERGYLTEPYKMISIMDGVTGRPLSELTDSRPSTRNRSSLLFSSVYHLTDDILYSSYRYYWDTWNVRSHTLDLKYRHDLGEDFYVEPLVRYYQQTAASFFTIGLTEGAPLPDYATSDYRLGALRTITLGSTIGFRNEDLIPGEWTVRAQYIRQSGDSSPPNAIGMQRNFDLSPQINIFSLVVGYSFNY